MEKGKIISSLVFITGIIMISLGIVLQANNNNDLWLSPAIEEVDIKNMATSTSQIINNNEQTTKKAENYLLKEINMEVAPAAVMRIEVFEGMTLEELAEKLNHSLKNDIAGKGNVIAAKSIELGVDPYVATAIILHETGCGQNSCSHIARTCYNFGGQKGSGCGAYKRYNSVDEGLQGMIQNLYNNYYSRGLTTVEAIGPRYAESGEWISKINWYIGRIREN